MFLPQFWGLEETQITPECRFKICGRFCENAERAITTLAIAEPMGQPGDRQKAAVK
jgi:hypothetical protein